MQFREPSSKFVYVPCYALDLCVQALRRKYPKAKFARDVILYTSQAISVPDFKCPLRLESSKAKEERLFFQAYCLHSKQFDDADLVFHSFNPSWAHIVVGVSPVLLDIIVPKQEAEHFRDYFTMYNFAYETSNAYAESVADILDYDFNSLPLQNSFQLTNFRTLAGELSADGRVAEPLRSAIRLEYQQLKFTNTLQCKSGRLI